MQTLTGLSVGSQHGQGQNDLGPGRKLYTPWGHVLTVNIPQGHFFLAPAPTESYHSPMDHRGGGPTQPQRTMQISIKQHAFSVRTVYAEGTQLTKAEAQALNGLRAENIRNNVFKIVQEALGAVEPGQVLPAAVHQELQDRITEYDLRYQFPLRHDARGASSPIEAEALAVATERVEAAIRQAEIAVVSRQVYDELLAKALADDAVQAEARRRVTLANAAAAKALEDLL